MYERRVPKPDPFEIMAYARRRVFVSISSTEYVVVIALKQTVAILRSVGNKLQGVETVWQTAQSLGLFNGLAWDIAALAKWVKQHCVVCWQLLGGKQRMYCSRKCNQKAYRERRR